MRELPFGFMDKTSMMLLSFEAGQSFSFPKERCKIRLKSIKSRGRYRVWQDKLAQYHREERKKEFDKQQEAKKAAEREKFYPDFLEDILKAFSRSKADKPLIQNWIDYLWECGYRRICHVPESYLGSKAFKSDLFKKWQAKNG